VKGFLDFSDGYLPCLSSNMNSEIGTVSGGSAFQKHQQLSFACLLMTSDGNLCAEEQG
jgi:hypothetical protein